jgi:hypothetical protein
LELKNAVRNVNEGRTLPTDVSKKKKKEIPQKHPEKFVPVITALF